MGRKAPDDRQRKPMVAAMKPGSLIIDLAAEAGGNCGADQCPVRLFITDNGVKILGWRNWPGRLLGRRQQPLRPQPADLPHHLLGQGRPSAPALPAADAIVAGAPC